MYSFRYATELSPDVRQAIRFPTILSKETFHINKKKFYIDSSIIQRIKTEYKEPIALFIDNPKVHIYKGDYQELFSKAFKVDGDGRQTNC